jgi:hypothetical protein
MSDDAKTVGCLFMAGVLILPVCFGGCYGLSKVDYSDGYRDGTIQKVSNKGVMFKTDEAEMILGGMTADGDGATATFNREKFFFTIADKEVLKQIEALPPGSKVRLHYRQSLTYWKPSGSSDYFATKVESLK